MVSSRLMPAANRIGSDSTAQNGSPDTTADPRAPAGATSVAVSNPSPNRNPIGYIFHGVSMRRASGPKKRFIMPRAFSWRSSSSWSNCPGACRRNMRTIETRMTTLRMAIR